VLFGGAPGRIQNLPDYSTGRHSRDATVRLEVNNAEPIVTEIYNELTAAGHADNMIPGKGWQVLAERLNAIAR
jgi:hypothetical protein